jgi:phosphatidyl-myo-inositol dimannoside synthase
MKLLFVSEGLDKDSIIAQPWRNIYEIAHSLMEQRHEVAIATDSPSTNKRSEIGLCGVPAYVLPKARLPPLMSQRMSAFELERLVEEFSPDVIYWDGGALIGSYIRKVKGINKPIVVHVNSNLYTVKDLRLREYRSIGWSLVIGILTASSPLARPLVRLLNHEPIKMITVPNGTIKAKLVKSGVLSKRIEVLPTPFLRERIFLSVERSQDFMEVREKIGLSPTDFIVAYLGPPRIYRGADTLLYAAARLKQKLPQLKVAMLLRTNRDSQDAQEKLLRRIASDLHLNENVKFVTGILGREELLGMMRAFDVIALPFKFVLNEPPITVLEAMALGKPLIITRVSGLPELVGDHAFLIEPRNDSDLADTIYFIANNLEEASRRARKGREYVLSLPEWSDYAEHAARLFASVRN